jgi:hypothetical protein
MVPLTSVFVAVVVVVASVPNEIGILAEAVASIAGFRWDTAAAVSTGSRNGGPCRRWRRVEAILGLFFKAHVP